jgi:hypothetical protein
LTTIGSKNKGERAYTKVSGDNASFATPTLTEDDAGYDLGDLDTLLQERGLDPEDWTVETVTINEWDGPVAGGRTQKLRQLKAVLKRRRSDLFPKLPTEVEGEYKRRKPNPPSKHDRRLVVMCGDQQAPFVDPVLHGRFCDWLEYNKPEAGVLIGDTVDFPDISRHRLNPENTASVQDCIGSAYSTLRDYVQASEDTYWQKLPGNHDERLRNTIIDWATELYGIHAAPTDDDPTPAPALSVENLLRLNELGIEYIDPLGQYDQAQVNLSKYLAVRHGWIAVKGSGASALKTLEHLGYSIVVGHTHRQSVVFKTAHDIDGNTTTLVGVEAGCMCQIGLGYSVAEDWQQGFAVAEIYPDGFFKVDLATFVDGVLLYRDQRFG